MVPKNQNGEIQWIPLQQKRCMKAGPPSNVMVFWLTYWCPCQGRRGGSRPGCSAWAGWSRRPTWRWRGRAWGRRQSREKRLLQELAELWSSFGKTCEQDMSQISPFSLVNWIWKTDSFGSYVKIWNWILWGFEAFEASQNLKKAKAGTTIKFLDIAARKASSNET